MRRRTRAEAEALYAAPEKSKPRKARGDPEAQVGFAVDAEMESRGFHVCDLSKKRKSAGQWISAVSTGVPDRYYWREDGLSVFVELKAPGGVISPAQQAFIDGHRFNPIDVQVWWSLDDCLAWNYALELKRQP